MPLGIKLYTCTDHDLKYPVGCASVILARSETEARCLLDDKLMKSGLNLYSKNPYTLQEVDINKSQAIILQDGDY